MVAKRCTRSMEPPLITELSMNDTSRFRKPLLLAAAALALVATVGAKAYGWHHGHHRPMSDAAIAQHIQRGVKYVLSDVDATAEQKAKVTGILEAAAVDVHALREQHLAAAREVHALLAAPTIDRARLEAVRADEMKLADQASKRIVDGIADAADVLTPDQRARLAKDHPWRLDDE